MHTSFKEQWQNKTQGYQTVKGFNLFRFKQVKKNKEKLLYYKSILKGKCWMKLESYVN